MPPKDVYHPGDVAPTIEDQLEVRLRVLVERAGVRLPTAMELLNRVQTTFLMRSRLTAVDQQNLLFERALGVVDQRQLPAQSLADYYLNMETGMMVAAAESPAPTINNLSPQALDGLLDAELIPATQVAATALLAGPLRLRPAPFDVIRYLSERVASANPLAAGFLADNPPNAAFKPALDGQEKADLTKALVNLPMVAAALAGKLDVVQNATQSALPRWFNPDAMTIEDSPEGEDVDTSSSKLLTAKDRPKAAHNIAAAFSVIANLTELDLLKALPMPTFLVAKSKQATEVNVRASTERGGVKITIDQNDDVSVCVHEFGHVVENFAAAEFWLDLQRLLHARHALAGDNTLAAIPHHGTECCYRADMPAFPHYSAKVYGGWGPTEVVSTSVQLLSLPKTAKAFIEADPQVAAIVLRWLSPSAFVTMVPSKLHAIALPTMYQ